MVLEVLLLRASVGLPERRDLGFGNSLSRGDVFENRVLSGNGDTVSPPGLTSVSAATTTMFSGILVRCKAGRESVRVGHGMS
jgi:hypothetical protein